MDAYTKAADQWRDELKLILLLLQRYVARHGHRLVQDNGHLSQLYVSFLEAVALFHGTPGLEALQDQGGWPGLEETQRSLRAARARIQERVHSAQGRLPLEELRAVFRLEPLELALLLAAAAPAARPDVQRLYRFAWADFKQTQPSAGFLAELVIDEPAQFEEALAALAPDATLVRRGLLRLGQDALTPLSQRSVHADSSLLRLLSGAPALLPPATAWRAALPMDQLIYEPEDPEQVRALVSRFRVAPEPPRVLLSGAPSSGRRTLLASALEELGWRLLEVDLSSWPRDALQVEHLLRQVLRVAALAPAAVALGGDERFSSPELLRELALPLGRALEGSLVPVLFVLHEPHVSLRDLLGPLQTLRLSPLSRGRQRALWRVSLEQQGHKVEEELPARLAGRFALPAGQIVRVAQSCPPRRSRRGPALEMEQLLPLVRHQATHALEEIADRVTTPLDWSDVVLPPEILETLREVLAHARYRDQVLDQWGFRQKLPYGTGLSCLFSGPPGTGKTMMAGVLARSLHQDLYRVDLARVASKWVGETEKNLARVFAQAERANAILLFDEADALFSSRTKVESANDRFANMEINYLLQRMESYDGMTILTTNFERGIDEAFKRRIRFKVTFPFPGEQERARLWGCVLPEGAAREEHIDYQELGYAYELSGGNIKNAAVRAAFYAAAEGSRISAEHLHRAASMEAREMGILVREA